MNTATIRPVAVMFEIKQFDPQTYRQQTRRSTFIIALIFLLLAMTFSTLAVMLFGAADGNNFWLNLSGVLAGLMVTATLLRYKLSKQPWMAAAVYGWQLKRSLMRVTNVMHHVDAGVALNNPEAMKLLRFYHLGLTQMHQLDGNSSDHSLTTQDSQCHKASMEALGLDTEQCRLDPAWLVAAKNIQTSK